MTRHEMALAVKVLVRAADEFSNHGCSDLRLKNTDDNWALVVAMETWNRTLPEDFPERPPNGEDIITEDWFVMSYLAHLFRDRLGVDSV